jgi:hypothetical protein
MPRAMATADVFDANGIFADDDMHLPPLPLVLRDSKGQLTEGEFAIGALHISVRTCTDHSFNNVCSEANRIGSGI